MAKIQATVLRAIRQAAAEERVAPELVAAVVWKESTFNPLAVGDLTCGVALGLGQQNLAGAGAVFLDNPSALLDPLTNARATAKYLREGLDRFAGYTARAVSGYNQGMGGASHADWYQVNGTNYVDPILAKMEEYRRDGLEEDWDADVPERFREYGKTMGDVAHTLLAIATDALETGRAIRDLAVARWGNR
jgi:soluble lytic murein transglycosylase-like protein